MADRPVSPTGKVPGQPSQFSSSELEVQKPLVEQMVPSLEIVDTDELAKPEAPPPNSGGGSIAGFAALEKSGQPAGALDLFYAGSGAEGHEVPTAQANAGHSGSEKAISDSSKLSAKEKMRVSARDKTEGDEAVVHHAQGVRYSFVRNTQAGEEEIADVQRITGDWKNILLTIEPNERGYLYVVASLGNGKWQPLDGTMAFEPGEDSNRGQVNAFRVVEYRLGGLTNLLGNLVVSSITVLFSRTPLDNVGLWLVGSTSRSQLQVERTDHSVYVVRPGPDFDSPLRVDINFEE